MRKKHATLETNNSSLSAIFGFYELKNLFRQGWLQAGMGESICESVAEHSFMVAVLCIFLQRDYFPAANLEKLLKMALLHETGEIIVGDFTPRDAISSKEKHELERAAVEKIFAHLPQKQEYLALWEEFENEKSTEANIIKQLDKLEMGIMAVYYEHLTENNLSSFFSTTKQALTDKNLRKLFQDIISTVPARTETI